MSRWCSAALLKLAVDVSSSLLFGGRGSFDDGFLFRSMLIV